MHLVVGLLVLIWKEQLLPLVTSLLQKRDRIGVQSPREILACPFIMIKADFSHDPANITSLQLVIATKLTGPKWSLNPPEAWSYLMIYIVAIMNKVARCWGKDQ